MGLRRGYAFRGKAVKGCVWYILGVAGLVAAVAMAVVASAEHHTPVPVWIAAVAMTAGGLLERGRTP